MKIICSLIFVSCLFAGCTQTKTESAAKIDFTGAKIIDLSHPFDAQTIYWPTEDGFKFEKGFDGTTPQGFYYAANKFSGPEHGGTHIDAPKHFAASSHTVDQIPVEQLIGNAIVIDVREQSEANRAIVLLRTGFAKHWPDRVKYMGTDERGAGAVAKLHFPGLHPDAARWLTTNRSIKAIGLDTPSIDYGQSTLFESHQILFAKNIPAFEHVSDMSALPAKDFVVIALPMKIGGGSGGPLRIVALLRPGS